jgi:hypothetical protein
MHLHSHTSSFITIVGWVGTIILLVSYALNSFGVIASTGIIYGVSNLLVAVFLGIRVWADRNWSNLTLQIVFGLIAVINIVMYIMSQ